MATREDYEAFFQEADADGSGTLSVAELKGILRKKGYNGSDSDLEKYFRDVDTSGDGQISVKEYMVAMGQIPEEEHKISAMTRCFRSFDLDGSGYIDKNELKNVFSKMQRYLSDAELKRMMALMDTDGDGKVDEQEFIAACFGRK